MRPLLIDLYMARRFCVEAFPHGVCVTACNNRSLEPAAFDWYPDADALGMTP